MSIEYHNVESSRPGQRHHQPVTSHPTSVPCAHSQHSYLQGSQGRFNLQAHFGQLLSHIGRCQVLEVAKLLDTHPTILQLRDRAGRTALHHSGDHVFVPLSITNTTNLATEDKSTKIAKILVARLPDLVESQDNEGNTPLHLAVINGNKSLTRLLLRSMTTSQINIGDYELHSAVHWATVCGQLDCLTLLLDSGCAEVATPDIYGAHPLHYATQLLDAQGFECGGLTALCRSTSSRSYGSNQLRRQSSAVARRANGLRILHHLLARPSIDLNCTDNEGRTPLLWAASSGNSEALLALVKAGAEISQQDKDGLSALHCASSRGHYKCVEILIMICGADVHQIDSSGCTPLFYATALGHADCVRLLLESGADYDHQDNKGRTAAHCGASKGQLETLKILHQHGANLWLKNVRGDLPLHEAVKSGRKDLVKWLLQMNKKSINEVNLYGRSALHIAAFNNNLEMCQLLLDQGADLNSVMKVRAHYLTPLDAAYQNASEEVAGFLQRSGARPIAQINQHLDQYLQQAGLEPDTPSPPPNAATTLNETARRHLDKFVGFDDEQANSRARDVVVTSVNPTTSPNRDGETDIRNKRSFGVSENGVGATGPDSTEFTKLPNLVRHSVSRNGNESGDGADQRPTTSSQKQQQQRAMSSTSSIVESPGVTQNGNDRLHNVREFETDLGFSNRDKHQASTHLKQAIITNVYLTTSPQPVYYVKRVPLPLKKNTKKKRRISGSTSPAAKSNKTKSQMSSEQSTENRNESGEELAKQPGVSVVFDSHDTLRSDLETREDRVHISQSLTSERYSKNKETSEQKIKAEQKDGEEEKELTGEDGDEQRSLLATIKSGLVESKEAVGRSVDSSIESVKQKLGLGQDERDKAVEEEEEVDGEISMRKHFVENVQDEDETLTAEQQVPEDEPDIRRKRSINDEEEDGAQSDQDHNPENQHLVEDEDERSTLNHMTDKEADSDVNNRELKELEEGCETSAADLSKIDEVSADEDEEETVTETEETENKEEEQEVGQDDNETIGQQSENDDNLEEEEQDLKENEEEDQEDVDGESVDKDEESVVERKESVAELGNSSTDILDNESGNVEETAEDEVDNAKEEIEDAKEEVKYAKEEVKYAKEEVEDAKEEVDDSKDEVDDAKEEVEDAKEEVDDSKDEVDDAKEEVEDAKDEVDDAKEEVEDAKEEVEDAKEDVEDAKKDVEDAKDEVVNAKEDVEDAKEEVDNVMDEVKDSKDEVDDAKEEPKDTNKEIINKKEIDIKAEEDTNSETVKVEDDKENDESDDDEGFGTNLKRKIKSIKSSDQFTDQFRKDSGDEEEKEEEKSDEKENDDENESTIKNEEELTKEKSEEFENKTKVENPTEETNKSESRQGSANSERTVKDVNQESGEPEDVVVSVDESVVRKDSAKLVRSASNEEKTQQDGVDDEPDAKAPIRKRSVTLLKREIGKEEEDPSQTEVQSELDIIQKIQSDPLRIAQTLQLDGVEDQAKQPTEINKELKPDAKSDNEEREEEVEEEEEEDRFGYESDRSYVKSRRTMDEPANFDEEATTTSGQPSNQVPLSQTRKNSRKSNYSHVRPKVDSYWSYNDYVNQRTNNGSKHRVGGGGIGANSTSLNRANSRSLHFANEDYEQIDPTVINQTVEKYLRKYYLERKLFEELYDLKRFQIRTGKSNEPQLVKRLVEKFRKDVKAPGMNDFQGPYSYRAYEIYIYDLLRRLSRSNEKKIAFLTKSISYEDLNSNFEKNAHSSSSDEMGHEPWDHDNSSSSPPEGATGRHHASTTADPLLGYRKSPSGLSVDYKYEYHKSQHWDRQGDSLVDVIRENLYKRTGLGGKKMDEVVISRKLVEKIVEDSSASEGATDNSDMKPAETKPTKPKTKATTTTNKAKQTTTDTSEKQPEKPEGTTSTTSRKVGCSVTRKGISSRPSHNRSIIPVPPPPCSKAALNRPKFKRTKMEIPKSDGKIVIPNEQIHKRWKPIKQEEFKRKQQQHRSNRDRRDQPTSTNSQKGHPSDGPLDIPAATPSRMDRIWTSPSRLEPNEVQLWYEINKPWQYLRHDHLDRLAGRRDRRNRCQHPRYGCHSSCMRTSTRTTTTTHHIQFESSLDHWPSTLQRTYSDSALIA